MQVHHGTTTISGHCKIYTRHVYYYFTTILITDTAYILHGDCLFHYDDCTVSQASLDTIDTPYIQVCEE